MCQGSSDPYANTFVLKNYRTQDAEKYYYNEVNTTRTLRSAPKAEKDAGAPRVYLIRPDNRRTEQRPCMYRNLRAGNLVGIISLKMACSAIIKRLTVFTEGYRYRAEIATRSLVRS